MLRKKNALPFRSNIACTVKSILSQKVHRSYLIVHLLIRIVTEYASNKKVTSSTDLDIGLKETGLAANKDENVDKVAHTSPVIGNQKSKLGNAQ